MSKTTDPKDRFNDLMSRLATAKNPAEEAYITASLNIDMLPEPAATVARRCGLLDWFDLGVVKSLVNDVYLPNAEAIFNQIIALPFVEHYERINAYEFHQLSAEGWRAHYNEHDPVFVKETFARAYQAYVEKKEGDDEYGYAKHQSIFSLIIGKRYNKAYEMIQAFLDDETIPIDDVSAFFWRLEKFPKTWSWVKLPPYTVDFYLYIGICLFRSHAYEESIERFSNAIDTAPNNYLAYRWRGNAYRRLKQYEKAIEDYSKAIELDPTDPMVLMSRMDCYNDMQQHDMAKADEVMAQKIHNQRYDESLARKK